MAAEIDARKGAQTIIIAEQGRWWTALPRALVQWSFAIFVVKCVVWDTVLGLVTTEPLGGRHPGLGRVGHGFVVRRTLARKGRDHDLARQVRRQWTWRFSG